MNEIRENGIHIYTGEIDEEDDSSEIRDLRVSSELCVKIVRVIFLSHRNLCLSQLLAVTHSWR